MFIVIVSDCCCLDGRNFNVLSRIGLVVFRVLTHLWRQCITLHILQICRRCGSLGEIKNKLYVTIWKRSFRVGDNCAICAKLYQNNVPVCVFSNWVVHIWMTVWVTFQFCLMCIAMYEMELIDGFTRTVSIELSIKSVNIYSPWLIRIKSSCIVLVSLDWFFR